MIYTYAAQAPHKPLQALSLAAPELKSDEVEIAVQYCGLCHSDLSMLNNDWRITQYPFVPGHEVVGRVVNLGVEVKGLSVGDRVGLGWHCGYCNHCHSCLSGDHNLCDQAQATIVGHHGGFANKVYAQATSVVKIPEALSSEVAGPLFCAGVTVFNPILQFDVKPTHRVAVVGIGGLGHLALQFLNKWGCEVTALSSNLSKAEEAKAFGAHRVCSSTDKAELKKLYGYFDFILVTVNQSLDWHAYTKMLNKKGRLHVVGAVLEPMPVSVMALMDAQRSVSSSPVGSPATLVTMLDFAARHGIQPLVEVFPMSQVNAAIEHLESGKARYRVVLKADDF